MGAPRSFFADSYSMEAGFSQLSQTMENRELYAIVIIIALAIVLMSGSVEVAIAMAAILTAAMYKLIEPEDDPTGFSESRENYAENNLLEPYLTPEQRRGRADAQTHQFAAAPSNKTPAKKAEKPIAKKPEPEACAELLEMLDSRTDDGNVNYLCHAKRKFRGREPKKTTTRDTIMRWVEDEPLAEENRHWWGAYEQ